MNTFALVRLAHVLIAVLGLGTITAIAVLARGSRAAPPAAVHSLSSVASLNLVAPAEPKHPLFH